MKFKTITQLAVLGALAFTSSISFGQFTGNIDDGFGDGGKLWYDWTGSGANSLLTKLVLDENSESFYFSGSLNSGGFNAMVVKADLSGELEADLTEGTIVYDPFIGLDDQFESVAVQDNGKIVAVGYSIFGIGNSDVIIARFNPDGTFDPTFNGGSALTFGGAGLDFATDVVIQDDGKIVIIGSYQVGDADLDLFFVRLNSDGSGDGTFGEDGVQLLNSHLGVEIVTNVSVLENGNIAAVGHAGEDLLFAQLDTEGNFDTDFSGDGTMNFKVNSLPTVANKLIELADGSFLLSGNTTNEGVDGTNGFIVKMNSSGLFDIGFGGGEGMISLNFETEMGLDTNFTLQDMELLESGQILVAADYKTDSEDIAIVLINADGELDAAYGDNGLGIYNLSSGSLPNSGAQIEVSSTGAVYLSGGVVSGANEDIVTFRLFGDISGLYEESPTALDFNLYPNPATDLLNIQIDMAIAGDLNLQIVDLTGKIVAIEQLKDLPAGQNTITIPAIGNLATGSYWLRVMTEGNAATQLFIKK